MTYIRQWIRHLVLKLKGGDTPTPVEYIGDTDYFD